MRIEYTHGAESAQALKFQNFSTQIRGEGRVKKMREEGKRISPQKWREKKFSTDNGVRVEAPNEKPTQMESEQKKKIIRKRRGNNFSRNFRAALGQHFECNPCAALRNFCPLHSALSRTNTHVRTHTSHIFTSQIDLPSWMNAIWNKLSRITRLEKSRFSSEKLNKDLNNNKNFFFQVHLSLDLNPRLSVLEITSHLRQTEFFESSKGNFWIKWAHLN